MRPHERIALNIIDHRDRLGVSPETVARRVGINRSHMCKIDDPNTSASIDIIDKVAAALGVRISVLLEPR